MKKTNIVKKILFLLLSVNIALADGLIVVNIDKEGTASLKETILTVKEFVIMQGYEKMPPKDSTAIILEVGKKAKWTNATFDELASFYNISKTNVVVRANNTPVKPPKEVSDKDDSPKAKEPKEAMEIFDDINSSDIQPLDGLWKSVFDSTKMSGCSEMMQSMLAKFTPPTTTMNLKFSRPFNPNKDLMNGQFKWKKIKANQWKGTMYNAPTPPGMSMTGEMLLAVVSEEKMNVRLTQQLILPEAMAQLTGSTTTCTVVSKGHYLKIK